MPLLNYTTRVPAEKTVAEIMKVLVDGGARQIVTVYDAEGLLCGLRWSIESRYGPLSYALPCNIEAVFAILTEDRILVRDPAARRRQAARVAWRIVKDWVEAQMALLATGMVELEEIFLPYVIYGDQTLYQALPGPAGRKLQGPAER